MEVASLVLGILSILGLIVGFFPCLGALNWLVIPIAIIGLVISLVARNRSKQAGVKTSGLVVAGLIMSSITIVFGFIRLILGGGLL
jgi:cobalamin biosynthesis protein CobD/CbiB